MIIGDDDFGAVKLAEQVAWNKLTALVVAVGIVGVPHAQWVFERQTRRDHEKATGEFLATWPAHGIDSLPGNQHGHNRSFACAGGQLESQAQEFRVCLLVGACKVLEEPASGFPQL